MIGERQYVTLIRLTLTLLNFTARRVAASNLRRKARI